ncbi:Prokaryotic lipoprotein-attachment site [Xylophilus ampelinus]|nr:lipoprotein [Variovorax sp.]VTY21797.1 Prokaryotic lipoprotein-attachment site [Xylophilus ampelinus]
MLNLQRILGSARARFGLGVACLAGLTSLAACGQRGPLYLPTEPAASQRATLPQIVVPALRDNTAKPEDAGARPAAPGASAPASGAGR